MGTKRVAAATATLLLVALTAQATVSPAHPDKPDPSASTNDTMQIVQRALEDVREDNPAVAEKEFDRAVQSPGFAGLPEDTRYQALFVASVIAWRNDHNDKAHGLAVKATRFPQAIDTAWTVRFSTAFDIRDYGDAAYGLTMFAQRWPAKLNQFSPGAVFQLHYQLKLAHEDATDHLMLDELFDAGWKANGVEPSALWRDLALQHLQRGEVARATKVALRVTSGEVALSMQVDKRFDRITRAHPDAFNVDRLVAAEIAAARKRMQAHPDQLQPITDLQDLYLITRQYDKVLSISDPVVSHAENGKGSKTYADFGDRYDWVLDNRSRAYKRQGQWNKAIATEALAARLPEQGRMNVSQSINLGYLCAELGQPAKATTAIIELGNMTSVGKMQMEAVKLRIALGTHDEPAASAAMDYMRAHRAEDLGTWQDALLLRGRTNEAAALLIARLDNPSWRSDALVAVQHYAAIARTPMDQIIHDRWNAITARPDVRAAMQKVGRTETFDIGPGLQ